MTTLAVLENSTQKAEKEQEKAVSLPSAPSSSQISEDSFATAISSAQSPPGSGSSAPGEITTQPHLSPLSLRKSASADSFIRCPLTANEMEDERVGEDGSQLDMLVDPDADASGSQGEARHLSSPPSTLSLSGYIRSKVGPSRKRGASYSTTDNETSTQEESDFDKASGSTTTKSKGKSVRTRLLSLKGTRSSGFSSGSEQRSMPPPPTRLPPRGTSASLSNLKTHNITSMETSPHMSSALSTSPPPLPVPPKRLRSQSVGANVSSSSSAATKRFSFGNQSTKPQSERKVSIAVVGPAGCGKSTFIRKSLKKHGLSSSEVFTVPIAVNIKESQVNRNIQYSCRTVSPVNESNALTHLSVLEFTTNDWESDDKKSLLHPWPAELPQIDGMFVCYDVSDPDSFKHVIQLIAFCKDLRLPCYVLACKSDIVGGISAIDAGRAATPYSKVMEISIYTDNGKGRIRRAFETILKDIINPRDRRGSIINAERPKVPTLTVQTSPPVTKTSSSSSSSSAPSVVKSPSPPKTSRAGSPSSPTLVKRSPSAPSSPARVRSLNDILSGHQKPVRAYDSDREQVRLRSNPKPEKSASKSSESLPTSSQSAKTIAPISTTNLQELPNPTIITNGKVKQKRLPPSPWVTLEELLEKLFFLAVGDDDPAFISHFFLTYRRFATPRSVLLGMQKRMNELRQPAGDATLACYAQMRICHLLEQWMRDYPSDFAVMGTYGALNAFVKQILAHPHTLCYGSDFLPFLDGLNGLVDQDSAWAIKVEDFSAESDSDSLAEFEPGSEETEMGSSSSSIPHVKVAASEPATSPKISTRERRSSLPLSAMGLLRTPYLSSSRIQRTSQPTTPSPREIVSRLQKVAQALQQYESEAIASEITRRELELFLRIERRDWLRHTLIPGKKDPTKDPVAKFNANYNELHEWAVSLILCHDRPKARARQIEKFAEVAIRLRTLNNYSGLRAIITAINQATFPGDQPMELFRAKTELHKKFLSLDVLLRTTGMHQSYRMALRNTKGPCIPSMEVHTSDLRRADEGNADFKPDDRSKINWAKFNMFGRFVATPTALQQRCIGPNGYKLLEHRAIGQLLDIPVMDYEMQQSRISPPAEDEPHTSPVPPAMTFAGGHTKEASVIKRILPW